MSFRVVFSSSYEKTIIERYIGTENLNKNNSAIYLKKQSRSSCLLNKILMDTRTVILEHQEKNEFINSREVC